jgi:hypothetical protein
MDADLRTSATMDVADELIALAEQLQRSYGPPVLAVRVASELPEARVHARARGAVHALGGGELHWSVDIEPSGVIICQWGHAPDIGETLRALAQHSATSRGRSSRTHRSPRSKQAR